MIALVTGDMGFVGQHLVKLLREQGHEVHGFDLKRGQDLRNFEDVRRVIDTVRPDHIYHLAAMAYVPESWISPARSFEVNTTGSLNVLEAVRQVGLKSKIMLAGTSEEYSDTPEETGVVTEHSLPNPLSPYAISKLAMDYLGKLYSSAYNMHIVIPRTFNHTGPGRGEQYAESAFAKQIAEIELGKRQTLEHGNLTSQRNYTDVRDIVKAYTQIINLESGIYNICSDENIKIGDMLSKLCSMSEVTILTKDSSSLHRPEDFSFKVPSAEKFTTLSGWEPTIPFDETLLDILNYWREKLCEPYQPVEAVSPLIYKKFSTSANKPSRTSEKILQSQTDTR